MKIEIRNAEITDLPYLYDICLKTGYNGDDASHLYSDPWLVGQYYVAPYVVYDATNCLIAYDSDADYQKPLGYIVGSDNTDMYYKWFYSTWTKHLQKIYGNCMVWKTDYEKWLIEGLYQENKVTNEALIDEFSGHLHIDLLPVLQGKGVGKRLLNEFSDTLLKKGCKGIHLGVSKKNQNAIGFYKKMEFKELQDLEAIFILGKKL